MRLRSRGTAAPGSIALVQRHAEERTRAVGLELARRELPEAEAVAVAAGDFPATLRRCFETAVALDHEWTVTIDGDVLLLPGSGRALRRIIARMPSRAGHADALVQDRVTGLARSAGVRIYRTSTMRAALEIGDWSGTLRPESHLILSLPDSMAPWSPTVLVGLHDHEQYLRDLFRTSFVMMRKTPRERERLVARWTGSTDDEDRVLLAGAEAALRDDLPFAIDASRYAELAEEFLREAGIEERGPLTRVPDPSDLERRVPAAAQRLRHAGLAAEWIPRVWRKAGNGARGLTLLRYALEKTFEAARRR